jgi:hypothetical protein
VNAHAAGRSFHQRDHPCRACIAAFDLKGSAGCWIGRSDGN